MWEKRIYIIVGFFQILFKVIQSLFFRTISWFIYPFIYPLRNFIRTNEILFPGYLYKWKKYCFLFWIFENDSETFDYEIGIPLDSKYYPLWLYKRCYPPTTSLKTFLLFWWFNSIRNSVVNLNNFEAFRLGEFIGEEVLYSYKNQSLTLMKKKKEGIWIVKHIFKSRFSNKISSRIYIEFYLFKRWFQFGWIKFGRFEIDLFKNR